MWWPHAGCPAHVQCWWGLEQEEPWIMARQGLLPAMVQLKEPCSHSQPACAWQGIQSVRGGRSGVEMTRARWPIKAIYDAEGKKPWRLSGRDPRTRAVGPRPCSAGSAKQWAGGARWTNSLTHCFPLAPDKLLPCKSRTGNKGGLCNPFIWGVVLIAFRKGGAYLKQLSKVLLIVKSSSHSNFSTWHLPLTINLGIIWFC